jgi:hypothetical protein
MSVVLYAKIKKEIDSNYDLNDINRIDSRVTLLERHNHRNFSAYDIISECLERLDSIKLLSEKLTLIEFIDNIFQRNSKDLIIPRWLSDLMVKIIDGDRLDLVVDLICKKRFHFIFSIL